MTPRNTNTGGVLEATIPDGWSLRDYYTSGALSEHLTHAMLVMVVTLEAFIRLANNGQL